MICTVAACMVRCGDVQGAMAGRILGLLWEMVMNPEAPPELSRSSGLVEAICHYGWSYAWPYMQRCVRKVADNDNAPTALHLLRRLCELLPQAVAPQVCSPPSASTPAPLHECGFAARGTAVCLLPGSAH